MVRWKNAEHAEPLKVSTIPIGISNFVVFGRLCRTKFVLCNKKLELLVFQLLSLMESKSAHIIEDRNRYADIWCVLPATSDVRSLISCFIDGLVRDQQKSNVAEKLWELFVSSHILSSPFYIMAAQICLQFSEIGFRSMFFMAQIPFIRMLATARRLQTRRRHIGSAYSGWEWWVDCVPS